MDKYGKITQEQFKELMEDIYVMAQDSKAIVISELIKAVENKMLSLMISNMYRKL